MKRIVKSRPTKQNIWVKRTKGSLRKLVPFQVVVREDTTLPGSMINGKFQSHLSANQNYAITKAIKAAPNVPCWAIPADTR